MIEWLFACILFGIICFLIYWHFNNLQDLFKLLSKKKRILLIPKTRLV